MDLSKPRILIIRGGAIGDFILTLPAIRLVREAFPGAHLEIIGYRHIVALADGRYYADATRSIEYGPMAGFFARRGTLAEEMVEYFASFNQVISFLFDPDGIFEANVRRAGVKNYLPAFVRLDDSQHAAFQLAHPLQSLALYLEDGAPIIHLTSEDRAWAGDFLGGDERPIVAIHPGSGSVRKNWPIEKWTDLLERLLSQQPDHQFLLVGGEADRDVIGRLSVVAPKRVRVAEDLALPRLAAVLARSSLYLGHDTGISHLAAAVNVPSVLLFGPTDPAIWAPRNSGVRTISAPDENLDQLTVDEVIAAVAAR